MRRWVILLLTLLLLYSVTATAQEYQVRVLADAMDPANITINVNDPLRVFMVAGNRNVVFDNGEESGALSPGTSVLVYFDQVGTINFQVEGEPEVAGTLTVVESGAPPPPLTEAEILAQGGNTHYVVVDDYEYLPSDIVVALGDTVVFEHLGQIGHSVDFLDEQGRVLSPGANYNRTFTAVGEYNYKCRFHNAMKGVVRVVSKEEYEANYADQLPVQTTESEEEVDPTGGLDPTTVDPDFVAQSDVMVNEEQVSQMIDDSLRDVKTQLSTLQQRIPTEMPEVAQFQNTLETLDSKVQSFDSTMQTQTEQVNSLQASVNVLQQDINSLQTQPTVEIPEPAPPTMLYVSLAIDVILVIVLLVAGVFLLTRKTKTPTVSKQPTKLGDKKPKDISLKKPLSSLDKKVTPDTTLNKPVTTPTPKDPNLSYIQKCKARGMLPHHIVEEFVKSGWKKEDAEKLVAKHT